MSRPRARTQPRDMLTRTLRDPALKKMSERFSAVVFDLLQAASRECLRRGSSLRLGRRSRRQKGQDMLNGKTKLPGLWRKISKGQRQKRVYNPCLFMAYRVFGYTSLSGIPRVSAVGRERPDVCTPFSPERPTSRNQPSSGYL